jgi:hypothetical protein
VTVTKTSAGVFVNGGSKVVIADVMASNGVIHVVDTVLMPPSLRAPMKSAATIRPAAATNTDWFAGGFTGTYLEANVNQMQHSSGL